MTGRSGAPPPGNGAGAPRKGAGGVEAAGGGYDIATLQPATHEAAEPCLLCPLCGCGYPCCQVVAS